MSRTIKTNPWWVRMAASPTLSIEVHDHADGICDLAEHGPGDFWRRGQCHLDPSSLMLYGPNSGCGCPMCSEHDWHRIQRRFARHRNHALAQQLRRGLAAGEDPDDLY